VGWNGAATADLQGLPQRRDRRRSRAAHQDHDERELRRPAAGPRSRHANVERRLREDGYTAIDCGKKPAYPAVVGSEVVCKVSKDGAQKYVVATVLEGSRTVQISDY